MVALLDHPAVAIEGPRIAGFDLNQELVEQSPSMLRPSLDEVEIIRPEERGPEVTGQVIGSPGLPINPDPTPSDLTIQSDLNLDLDLLTLQLDHRLEPGFRPQRSDQVRLPSSPGRGTESEHGNRFQEIGLALPVAAQEEVQTRVRF